jgi:hypothetical protein
MGCEMGIKEIPKSYRYTCEGCGAFLTQENADGHYINSTPRGWATVIVNTNDASRYIEKLFCNDCQEPVIKMITTWKGRK